MKYLHLLVALLFALFAYWQLNDADWPAWVAMYGTVAIVAGLTAFGRPPQLLVYAGLAAAGIWMATLVPDFISWVTSGMPTITGQMKAESPHVELTREFLGLLISALTLVAYAVSLRRKSSRAGTGA